MTHIYVCPLDLQVFILLGFNVGDCSNLLWFYLFNDLFLDLFMDGWLFFFTFVVFLIKGLASLPTKHLWITFLKICLIIELILIKINY